MNLGRADVDIFEFTFDYIESFKTDVKEERVGKLIK